MVKKKTSTPRKRKGTIEEQENRDKFNALRSFLRRCWSKYPERAACIRESRRPYKGPNKRVKWEHQCNICKNWYVWKTKRTAKNGEPTMSVDHIIPAGTFLCADDYNTFIPNLFCDRSGLQVLCDTCHNKKTQEDRK